MKRTLHLTAVMLLVMIASVNRAYGQEEERAVLYETDFSDGLDEFRHTWTNIDASQYYDSDRKCVHLTSGQSSYIYLYRAIGNGKKFYKDVIVECEYETSNPECFELKANFNAKSQKSTGGNPLCLDVPVDSMYIYFGLVTPYTNEPFRVYDCYVKSIKVTGILLYDAEKPEQTISKLSDFWSIPEGTCVKIELDSALIFYSQTYFAGIMDSTGTVLINNEASVGHKLNQIRYSESRISGNIVGIVSKSKGAPELSSTYRDVTVSKSDQSLLPEYTEIDQKDYRNHLWERVTLYNITEPIDLYYFGQNITDTILPVSKNLKVSGYVYPDENNNTQRLVLLGSLPKIWYTEDGENDITEECSGYEARIPRAMEVGKWYTLCVPFEIYSESVAVFESYDNGVLKFKTNTNWEPIEPGRPVLYKPEWNNISTFAGYIQYPFYSPDRSGDYSFVGTFNPVQPKDGSYYLTEGNTIRPLASGGTIKAFRGYFEPNTPNVAKARAISIDGVTTAIEDIEWGDGDPFLAPTDSNIYNLEGQMVGTNLEQLPKGMYIVNGKKVIK